MYNINNRAVRVIVEEVVEELNETLGSILDGADETLDSFKEVKEWLDAHKDEFDEHSKASEKIHETIQEAIKELQSKHDSDIEGVQTETKDLVEGVQTSLSEEISNGLQTLSELIDAVKDEINVRIDGVQEVFDGKIEGVQDELKENITGVQGEFDAKIEGVQGELNEACVELEVYIEGVQEAHEKRMTGIQEDLDKKVAGVQTELENSIADVYTEMYAGFQSLGDAIEAEENQRSTEDTLIRTEMREGFQSAEDNLRGVQEAHEDRMTGIQDDLTSGLEGAQAELEWWVNYLLGNQTPGLDSFKETVEWIQGHQLEFDQLTQLHENDVKGVQAQLALTREAVGIDGDVNVVDFIGAQYIKTSTVREGVLDLDNSLKVEELARIKRDDELQASLGAETDELLSKTFDYFQPKYQNIGKDSSVIPGGEDVVNFLDGSRFEVAPTSSELHNIFVNGYTDDDTQETVYGIAAIKSQYGEYISVRGDYYKLVPQSRYIADVKNVKEAIITIDKTISGLQDAIEDTFKDNRDEFLKGLQAHEDRMDGIQTDIETLDDKVEDNWKSHEDRFDGVQEVLTNVINTIGCGDADGKFENNFDDPKYVTSDTVMGVIEDLDNALYDEEESRKDIDDKLQTIVGACDSELENKNIDFSRPTYVPTDRSDYDSDDEWEIVKNIGNDNVKETVPTYDDYRDDYVNNSSLVPKYIRVGLGYYALQIGAKYIDDANNLVAAVLKLDNELNRVETEVNTALDGAQAYTDSKVEYLEGVIETGLNGAQDNLQSAVDTLNGTIDGNQTELEERISGVQTDLDDAVVQLISTIDGNQTELEERISGVQDDLTAGLEGAQTNLQDVVNTLNTTISGVQDDLTAGLDGAQNNLQSTVDTLNKTIDGVQKDVDRRFAGVQGQFEFIMDNADTNYIDSFREVCDWIQDNKEKVDDLQETVLADIVDLKKRISDEVSKLKFGVPTDQVTDYDHLDTGYDTLSNIRERFKDVDDKISGVQGEIKNDVSELEKHITASDVEHTKLNERIDGVQKDLTDGLDGAQTNLQSAVNTFNTTIGGVQDELTGKIDSSISGVQSETSGLIKGVQTQVETGLDGAQSNLQSAVNTLNTTIDGVQKDVDNLLFKNRDSFDARIEKLDEELVNTKSSLEELSGKHESDTNDVKSKISGVQDEINTVNEFTKGVQTQVEKGLNDAKSNLNSAVDTLNTTIDGVQKDVDNLLFKNRDSFDARLDGVQKQFEDVQTQIETGLNGVQNNLQSAVDTLNTTIGDVQKDVDTRLDGVQKQFEGVQEQFGLIMENEYSGVIDSFKEVADWIDGHKDIVDGIQSSVFGNIVELQNRIDGVISDTDKKIEEATKDIHDELDIHYNEFKADVESLGQHVTESNSKHDELNNKIGDVQTNLTGFQTYVDGLLFSGKNSFDVKIEGLDNKLGEVESSLNDLSGKHESEIKGVQDQIDNAVKDIKGDGDSFGELNTISKIGSWIKGHQNEFDGINSSLNGVQSELNGKIDSNISGVQSELSRSIEGVQNQTERLVETQIRGVQGEINTVNDFIKGVQTDLALKIIGVQNDLNSKDTDTNHRIDTITNTVNDNYSKLDEKVDREVSSLESRIMAAITGDNTNANNYQSLKEISRWIEEHGNDFDKLQAAVELTNGTINSTKDELKKYADDASKDAVDKYSQIVDGKVGELNLTKADKTDIGNLESKITDKLDKEYSNNEQLSIILDAYVKHSEYNDVFNTITNTETTLNNRISNVETTLDGKISSCVKETDLARDYITKGDSAKDITAAITNVKTDMRGEIDAKINPLTSKIDILDSSVDEALRTADSAKSATDSLNGKIDTLNVLFTNLQGQINTIEDTLARNGIN